MKPLRIIMNKIASMKLVNKLIPLYIGIVAVPFTCLGIYAINYNHKLEEEEIVRNGNWKNNLVERQIGQNVDTCTRIAYSLLLNNDLIEFIGQYREYSPVELREFENDVIIEDISKITNINSDINRIRIFTQNPHVSESFKYIYRYESLDESLLPDELSSGTRIYYWVFNEKEKGLKSYESDLAANVVSLYTLMMKSGNKTPIGILEVNMKVESFFQEIFNSAGVSSTVVFIPDKQGKLIMDPSAGIFTSNDLNTSLVLKSFRNYTNDKSGDFRMTIGGKKYLVVYKKMDVLNLIVGEITSLDYLSTLSRRNGIFIFLGVFGILVILSIATKFVTELVLGKTHTIIHYMRQVEKGDLRISIPDFGKDEIGELGKHFKVMIGKLNKLVQENLSREILARDAQIKALQSQINAHFMYNVLETIGMMAHLNGNSEIHGTVIALGELMRYSMQWKSQMVTLRDELEYIRNYLALLNVRYDYSICLSERVDEDALDQQMLKMTLQPIIENAVKHGIEPEGENATIRLAAFKRDEKCVIEISDNGIGMSEEELEMLRRVLKSESGSNEKEHGIGLKNVYDRIKACFGDECLMDIASLKGCYTKVCIVIPWKAAHTGGGTI